MQVRRAELPGNDREDAEEVAPLSAVRTLLTDVVDYAGLFPPASVDVATAVSNYASYARSADAWMLGRLVVPAARLEALTAPAGWRLSVTLGSDPDADLALARAFNKPHVRIDAVEARFSTTGDIGRVVADAGDEFEVYVEIPARDDPAPLVAAVRDAGALAKIRTGGTTADAFPTGAEVVRFMRRCKDARVAFKATAGLHHPVRASYRLTYEPDAACGTMFGFLNVFLAAALLYHGLDDETARQVLDEMDPSAFHLSDERVGWRHHALDAEAVHEARALFVRSFGSCSFREPVDEVRPLIKP
jgi:hypothetical protein